MTLNQENMHISVSKGNTTTATFTTPNHIFESKPITTLTTLEAKRGVILDNFKQKQSFRVSIGKTNWVDYKQFNPNYNLREILDDEIVIEFDEKNWKGSLEEFKDKISWSGINLTAVNLYNANITFEIWDHNGKSPHLHIHNLPIKHLDPDKRVLFKKMFIRKYVPSEYFPYVDMTLTGIHLIAIENQNHWKGCYGIKTLLSEFYPIENNPIEQTINLNLDFKEINLLNIISSDNLEEHNEWIKSITIKPEEWKGDLL